MNAELYDVDGPPADSRTRSRLRQLRRAMRRSIREGQDASRDNPVHATVRAGLDWGTLSAGDRQLAEFLLNGLEQEYAGSARDLSTYWFDAGRGFAGPDVVFTDGYRVIVDHLARGLPVELGQRVLRVTVDAAGVTIDTRRGRFVGDRAIVTLPLGVLKRDTVRFSPAPPARMRRAIEALEMGILNKCYLRFPFVFWPDEMDWHQYVPREPGRWSLWLSMTRSSGQPILAAFNAAEFGREIEALPDAAIVAGAMETLRTIFGSSIPAPLDSQITRWGSDRHTFGSYSFIPVGGHPGMRDDLAGDIEGRVFFAGEAASRAYAATVHGAYLSGLDTAARVVSAPALV